MRRVVFNQKGGVGKSSIAVNLAALAASSGRRTLVIDLDPQGNASQYLLGAGAQPPHNAADFFEQFLAFRLQNEGLDAFASATPFAYLRVLPSSPALGEIQGKLEQRYKIFKLRDALDAVADEFDEVFIDTAPAFNFYSLSALIAADAVLIPFDCDDFSRQALYQLLDRVAEVRADHNEALQVEGIVVNQYQSNANLPQRVVGELRDENLPLLDTLLPASVKMRESHEAATPLVHFAPRHKLTLAFRDLFAEISD
ncbi:MAG: ParA family protein [Bacteroidota bacterium]